MVEQKKDVIYVPYWIASALERNNLPLSTIVDYRKMAHFLSAQEQGNMLLFEDFNPFKEKVANGQHTPTFGMVTEVGGESSITEYPFTSPLYEAWRKCVSGSSDANDNKLFKNLDTMNSLAWNQMAEQEVAMRFATTNSEARVAHNHSFITYDVEREFLIVVVYPAFFESAKYADNVIALCKEVLKVLYVYNTPASGCKTPYFRKYLESLA
jgi:hypothetical protein